MVLEPSFRNLLVKRKSGTLLNFVFYLIVIVTSVTEMIPTLSDTVSAAQVCTRSTPLGSGFILSYLGHHGCVHLAWRCHISPSNFSLMIVFCCRRLEKRQNTLEICISQKSCRFWNSLELWPNINKSRRPCGQVTVSILSFLQWPLEAATVQFDPWRHNMRSVGGVDGLLGSFPVFIVEVLHHDVLHMYPSAPPAPPPPPPSSSLLDVVLVLLNS